MMRRGDISEADLARSVVTELQRQGYDTYEEVTCGYASNRADIVAVRGPVLAVVECKVAFSMKLLDQMTGWSGGANLIIGAAGFTRLGIAAQRYLRSEGFGFWTVHGEEIIEEATPRLLRHADTARLRKHLCSEMQSAEAAKAGTQGGYWTPFRATCRDLERVVKAQPGIALREALKLVKHHYANEHSAVSSIPNIIKRGLLTGIRCEGKPLMLYPVEAEVIPMRRNQG